MLDKEAGRRGASEDPENIGLVASQQFADETV